MAPTKEPAVPEVIRYVEVAPRKKEVERFNVWASAPRADWEYVTVPKQDIHGYSFPPVSVNQDYFCADQQTYPSQAFVKFDEEGNPVFHLPPMLAREVNDIVKRQEQEQIALLQPKLRKSVLDRLYRNPGAVKVAAAAGGSTATQVGVPGTVLPA